MNNLKQIGDPEVEIIKADTPEMNKVWCNVSDGKVKNRYVIDMSTLKKRI